MKRTNQLFSQLSLVLAVFMLLPVTLLGFGSKDDVGTVNVESGSVWIERNGEKLPVNQFGRNVQTNDLVKTGTDGRALISFLNDDTIYLAPRTEIKLTEQIIGKRDNPASRLIKLFYGKIRAKIQKTRKKRFVVKTATATIGVKGTDFIAEFTAKQTRVGTVEGLVNLLSDKTRESVDIPAGSMASVSVFGVLMPLEEFAGELMEDVEFAGKKMTEDDIAGEKVTF